MNLCNRYGRRIGSKKIKNKVIEKKSNAILTTVDRENNLYVTEFGEEDGFFFCKYFGHECPL